MKLNINKNESRTISKQISEQIRDKIYSGTIIQGSKLPSIRELSKSIGVSPLTIIRAYNRLAYENLIEKVPYKGSFVKIEDKILKPDEIIPYKDKYQWQLTLDDYIERSQFSSQFSTEHEIKGFNMFAAILNNDLIPSKVICNDLNTILDIEPDLLSKYSPIAGDISLRRGICKYLEEYNLNVLPHEMIITNGAQQGLSIIADTFVGLGDVVFMETPTFPGAIDVFKNRGSKIISLPMDENGIKVDILEKLCEKYNPKIIYLTPNFNNPLGYLMSYDRRIELLETAELYNFIIVEDDPWGEFSFEDRSCYSIKSLDKTGHVIYVKGFSKVIGPGFRIAALIANGSILTRLISSKANADLGSPLLSQKIVSNFINSGKLFIHVNEVRKVLCRRKDLAINLLKQFCPKEVTWIEPRGGMNIWITFPDKFNTENLLYNYAHNEKISFLLGRLCYPNEPQYNHLRISFSYLSEEDLKTAIRQLSIIMQKFIDDETSRQITPIA